MQTEFEFPKKWVFPDILPVGFSLGGVNSVLANGKEIPLAYDVKDRISISQFIEELQLLIKGFPEVDHLQLFWADKSDNIYFSNFIPITFFHV